MGKKGLAVAVLATTAVGGAVAKRLLDQSEGPEQPVATPESSPTGNLTRGELYERARRLGIPGRSKMNKRQLQEAVASADH
jgi:hypothetical protein